MDGFGIVLAINNDSSQPETNGLVKSKLTFFYNVFVNKSDPDEPWHVVCKGVEKCRKASKNDAIHRAELHLIIFLRGFWSLKQKYRCQKQHPQRVDLNLTISAI